MRKFLILAAVLGAAGVAHAQAPAPARAPAAPAADAKSPNGLLFSAADLKAIQDKQPAGFSTRLFNASTYSTAFIRLAKPDTPHAHGTWSEVFFIKEGSGELTLGGTIGGELSGNSATHGAIFTEPTGQARTQTPAPAAPPRPSANGDLSGTTVTGGTVRKFGPGDFVLVPAGVSHVFSKVDSPVVYLDVKFPKAN